jgi:Asp-tRNA(Asn)/Glu-tRNA(Gln) amidotransferase A subunit family amidase
MSRGHGGGSDLAAWEARFREREPELHAFVEEPERFGRVRAAAASTAASNGALAGLLLGVKDIFHVAGLPTRAGSQLPASLLAGEEGPCVRALREAGALVAGKTATTEFAYLSPGPTRNPKAPGHTPGGSSSGSAAAVAAELCDLALGTQTIGSIGRPAAFCGVVGWKPSRERLSRAGVIPLAPSLDHVGLFARDVATLARAAPVATEDWRIDVRPAGDPQPSPRLRLGIPTGPYLQALSPAGREHFARLRAHLEGRGFRLLEVASMPDFAAIAERHRRLVAFEAAEVHADWYGRLGALYAPQTAELIERGRTIPEAEAARARDGRMELRADLESAMEREDFDLWLSPPAVGPAPASLQSTGDPVMNLPWTYAGLPTLVLRAGETAPGPDEPGSALPMGAQFSARFGADEELLAWGAALERELAGLHSKGER